MRVVHTLVSDRILSHVIIWPRRSLRASFTLDLLFLRLIILPRRILLLVQKHLLAVVEVLSWLVLRASHCCILKFRPISTLKQEHLRLLVCLLRRSDTVHFGFELLLIRHAKGRFWILSRFLRNKSFSRKALNFYSIHWAFIIQVHDLSAWLLFFINFIDLIDFQILFVRVVIWITDVGIKLSDSCMLWEIIRKIKKLIKDNFAL